MAFSLTELVYIPETIHILIGYCIYVMLEDKLSIPVFEMFNFVTKKLYNSKRKKIP